MTFKLDENNKCRYFDINVDEDRSTRHIALMMHYSAQGHARVGDSENRPIASEGHPMRYRHKFFLQEELADDYIQRMSEPVTDAEKGMDLTQARKLLNSGS